MACNTNSAAQGSQGASLSQFLTTLAVAAVIAALQIAVFTIIRRTFKRIYEPKTYLGDEKRRVKSLPASFCGWLPALLKMPQEDLIRTSGLDAYFFARYLYVHAFFFLISFVLLAIILFPIYIVDGKGEANGKTGLDILTFGNISPRNSPRYAAPLVLAYVFIGVFLYILYAEMKAFIEKRQMLLRSPIYQSRASASTILVTAIPKPYMKHDVLHHIFNQFPGGVKYIWLNRDLEDLPDKADERMKLVQKLETVECKLIKWALKKEQKRGKKNGHRASSAVMDENMIDRYIPRKKRPTMRVGSIPVLSSLCCGKKVDAITHCMQRISQLNTEIETAKENEEHYDVLNSAFIQFNRQIAAHMAAQCVTASIPLAMTPRYIDVKPNNIIWPNLKIGFYEKRFRHVAMLAATLALIIFWAIPVAFVGFLSNLTYLTDKLTFLRFICNLPEALLGLVTGLLPTVLLAILMALLPIALRLFAKLSGIPTTDAIDRYVQGSYFVFQVVHAFLVVTISSSVASVVTKIIQNPPAAATLLAANIPTASNFFFSYLALQGLNMAASILLQIVTLILFYLLGKLLDNTPRKKWKRYFTLTTLSWGTVFPVFTNFVVITLVYSVIAPLILLIAGLAFILFYIAYTYKMFYVSDFPNDTGGLSFPRAIYQSFTGIYLMEIMLAGLFFLARNESDSLAATAQGVLMCVLIFITIGIQWTMSASFDPLTHYLPVDADEFGRLEMPIAGKLERAKAMVRVLKVPGASNDSNTVVHIHNAVFDAYNNTMRRAYMHPAMRDPAPIVWIPKDKLDIAEDEVQRTAASGLNLQMSTSGAQFNEKFKIEIDSPPPDHVDVADKDDYITRF